MPHTDSGKKTMTAFQKHYGSEKGKKMFQAKKKKGAKSTNKPRTVLRP